MPQTEAGFLLTDDERNTIVNALKLAIAVAELDAVKAYIRYDKDEMSYQGRLIQDLGAALNRMDR